MKEIPFLQMELQHRLTVRTRGVMIEPSGTRNCEANRPGTEILVSDLAFLPSTLCTFRDLWFIRKLFR